MPVTRVICLHIGLSLPSGEGKMALRDVFHRSLKGIPHTLHNWVSSTSQLSAGYDERTGLAKKYPTLEQFLWKEVPEWRHGDPVVLVAFSAGCWAVRHWLKDDRSRALASYVLLLDGLHSSGSSMDGVVEFGRLANDFPASHRLIVTNSEIDPVTYASTSDTAARLLDNLGAIPRERHDEGSTPGCRVLDYATTDYGNRARDHVVHVSELAPRILETDCVDHIYQLTGGTVPGMKAVELPDGYVPLGVRCVEWCMARMREANPPTAEDVRHFFSYTLRKHAGVERPTRITSGNFCSAAQGAALEECRLPGERRPHLPRASAKWEMIRDARRLGTWRLVNERVAKASGAAWLEGDTELPDYVPEVGDLAIYHRGPKPGALGHIDRVCEVIDDDTWKTIGANEVPYRDSPNGWKIDTVRRGHPTLIGFVSMRLPEPE